MACRGQNVRGAGTNFPFSPLQSCLFTLEAVCLSKCESLQSISLCELTSAREHWRLCFCRVFASLACGRCSRSRSVPQCLRRSIGTSARVQRLPPGRDHFDIGPVWLTRVAHSEINRPPRSFQHIPLYLSRSFYHHRSTSTPNVAQWTSPPPFRRDIPDRAQESIRSNQITRPCKHTRRKDDSSPR